MKIATLYRKEGKVILETDNDAVAQVATDTPQDVVVAHQRLADSYSLDSYSSAVRRTGRPPALAAPYGQDVPPQGIAALRQIATELRTRHVADPSPTLAAFADRIDAAIGGLDCAGHGCGFRQASAMTGPIIPAEQWPAWADRHCWDADGAGMFIGAVTAGYPERSKWASSYVGSGIPMPAGHDWRVPVMRQPAIDLERFMAVLMEMGELIAQDAYVDLDTIGELQGRLLALIDGQSDPLCVKKLADCQYPKCGCNYRPNLCDLCGQREEVRSDAEGVPFCQERWDGWQAEEAKAVQPGPEPEA